jgi:hypothetical protein
MISICFPLAAKPRLHFSMPSSRSGVQRVHLGLHIRREEDFLVRRER